jgi:sigma-B regulation protein RsbU (phosphoserine phosphatase)
VGYNVPENIAPENAKFFVITRFAYIFGGISHLILGIVFWLLCVKEMAWFNFAYSLPVFCIAFILNLRARHEAAFFLAFSELLMHQVAGVYVLGWGVGFQYFLIYLAGLTFFNARWRGKIRVCVIVLLCAVFTALYLYCQEPACDYVLSKTIYQAFFLSSSLTTLVALSMLIHYYVQAATRAEQGLTEANNQLSKKNLEIEKTLEERNQAFSHLNAELQEAARYVREILPEPIMEGPIRTDWRFIPSTALGGDAFGHHWLDEDRFVLYLIDVSGHGVGAALLSVSIMNALRAQSLPRTDFSDPASVLESLNQAFSGEDHGRMFFTIWYGVYSKSTRQMIYASGGHPPALLFGENGNSAPYVSQLRTPNFVIGGMRDVEYKKAACTIPEGGILYIFSDGVYEVRKMDGSVWRYQEFADYMTRAKPSEKSRLDLLHSHARNLANSEHLDDDFTILEVMF